LESVTPSLELTVFHKGGKTPNPTQPSTKIQGRKKSFFPGFNLSSLLSAKGGAILPLFFHLFLKEVLTESFFFLAQN